MRLCVEIASLMPPVWRGRSAKRIATIISIVVTAVVTPIAGPQAGAAWGNIAKQGFRIAIGNQKKFNWAEVAAAALGAHIESKLGWIKGVEGYKELRGPLHAAARNVGSSVIRQGANMAFGVQKKFDWTSLAVAGVSGAVTYSFGGVASKWAGGDKVGTAVLMGTASLLSGAATRSFLTGDSFGKSIRDALPDAISNTIGQMIVAAVESTSGGEAADATSKEAMGGVGHGTGIKPPSNARLPYNWAIDTSQYDHLNKLTFETDGASLDMSAGVPSFSTRDMDVQLAAEARQFARNPKVDYSASQNFNFHDPKYRHITEIQVGDAEIAVDPFTDKRFAAYTGLPPPKAYLISENVSKFTVTPYLNKDGIRWQLTDSETNNWVDTQVSYRSDATKEIQLGEFGKLVFVPQYNGEADRFLSAAYSGVRDFEFGLVEGLKFVGEHPMETLQALGETARKLHDPTGVGRLEIATGIAQAVGKGLEGLNSGYQSAARNHTLPEWWGRAAGQMLPNIIPGPGGALRGTGLSRVGRNLGRAAIDDVAEAAGSGAVRLEKNVRLDAWRSEFGQAGDGYAALVKDLPKGDPMRKLFANALRDMRTNGVAVRRAGNEMGPTIGVFGGESLESGVWFRYNPQKMRVIDMMEETTHWGQIKSGLPSKGYSPATLEILAKQSILQKSDLPVKLRMELKDDIARVKNGSYFEW